MSKKKERSHGQQMHTLGELNASYEILNLIHARIVELEMIVKEDEKQSEKNDQTK